MLHHRVMPGEPLRVAKEPDVVLTPGQFYGQVNRQWKSDLVSVSTVRHAAARKVPEHQHAHAFITLVLRGQYREVIDTRTLVYQPLSVVFHPPGLRHHDEIGLGGAEFLIVELAPEMMKDDDAYEMMSTRSLSDLTGGPSVWMMLGLLRNLPRASHSPLTIEEPVAELVDTLAGAHREVPQQAPSWLARVERLIEARYREPLPMLAFAKEAGVHPVHVSRVYRGVRGHSIRMAVHRLRVLEACRLLEAGRYSLAEIAVRTGFCDQSHLSTVCRRVTGFSPRYIRALMDGGPHDIQPRP
jgi:AraC family transcriptional regulator